MELENIVQGAPVLLTDNAAAKARYFAKEDNVPSDKHLRIFVISGGCSGMKYGFTFDTKRDTDEIYRANGIDVLIDNWSLPLLEGSTVDYLSNDYGSGFTVDNPRTKKKSSGNEKKGCCDTGCG